MSKRSNGQKTAARRVATAGALALLAGSTLAARPAWAQSSPVSELWREWAVLEQAWRAEKTEVEADRKRLRERAAKKADAKAPEPPRRGG